MIKTEHSRNCFSKLEEISISEEHSSINSANSNVSSNGNGFRENSFEGRNNSNGKLRNLTIKCFTGNQSIFKAFSIHFEQSYMTTKTATKLLRYKKGDILQTVLRKLERPMTKLKQTCETFVLLI